MYIRSLIGIFLLSLSHLLLAVNTLTLKNMSVDFDESMGKGSQFYKRCINNDIKYNWCTFPRNPFELFSFFKSLYLRNNLNNVVCQINPKIPKIIHIQWIGKEFPEKFHKFRESWIALHPTWTHVLWTDNPINYKFGTFINDVNTLKRDLLSGKYAGKSIVLDIKNLIFENKRYYLESKNIGEKTDITAYEFVYQFGGVYIDVDFECLQSLDILHHCYDYYIGIQPLDETLALGKGIFGAIPGHPILKHCISTIQNDRNKNEVIKRTGPIHCTRSFWASAPTAPGINIALPASFFYPVKASDKNLTREEMNTLVKPESFGIHHWAASWR